MPIPCVGLSLQYDRVPDRMDDYYFVAGIRMAGDRSVCSSNGGRVLPVYLYIARQ